MFARCFKVRSTVGMLLHSASFLSFAEPLHLSWRVNRTEVWTWIPPRYCIPEFTSVERCAVQFHWYCQIGVLVYSSSSWKSPKHASARVCIFYDQAVQQAELCKSVLEIKVPRISHIHTSSQVGEVSYKIFSCSFIQSAVTFSSAYHASFQNAF